MKIPWFLLIFIAIFIVIGVIASILVRLLKEKKLQDIKNIHKAAVYVKFINNFKQAEELEKKGEYNQAIQFYAAALQILIKIPDKDELVMENINNIENKIKTLDKRQKKVHNK
jgi:NADH:ubiquinone oxidoreductase subunit 3 (subunit A)